MSHLAGKTVLVTGAGGSIGSELCRQILRQQPKKLILFDNSELGLYNIDRDLAADNVVPMLGDITRSEDLSYAFQHRVDVVYHAAAYKHVTLCEKNSVPAYRVNVDGTRLLVNIAQIWNVPTLVLVSTDKAVRPTCVMGHTKKRAEEIVRAAGYTVVRLGNVQDSSGSVLPLWREQIAKGEPVTITDVTATRYFIAGGVAARAIVAAATLGPGTFVPDMGEPRMMGEEALRLGAKGLHVIGLRPGEKLHEELFVGYRAASSIDGIFQDAA